MSKEKNNKKKIEPIKPIIEPVSSEEADGPIQMSFPPPAPGQVPPNFPPPERLEENIAECQKIIRTGIKGAIVTVTPRDENGVPRGEYKAIFVEFVRGHRMDKAENGSISHGSMTDAIVMRPTGMIDVVSPSWLRFNL